MTTCKDCLYCLPRERRNITVIDDPRVVKLPQTIGMDAVYRVTWDFLDPPEYREKTSILITELEKVKNWQVTRSNFKPLPDDLDEQAVADAFNEMCREHGLPLISTKDVCDTP